MDLANLFYQPAPTSAFAQGVLTAFDPLTGDNTVSVNGSLFTNLALLNVPDVVNMTVGSVVMLAQLGGSYAIMGRVVLPGTALLNTSAISTDQASLTVSGATTLTSPTAMVSAGVVVPAWANRISFFGSGNTSCTNSTGSPDNLEAFLQYSGSFGTGIGGGVQIGAASLFLGCVTCTAVEHQLTVNPGETVTFSLMAHTQVAPWVNAANSYNVDVLCFFQHV